MSYLVWLFADSHCTSQFAYQLFFDLLLKIAYTFAAGIVEQINERKALKAAHDQKLADHLLKKQQEQK
jgi:hypothetical protein